MATSSKLTSIRKAQVPVSCYFCKGQEIKWRCDDCNVRMCNSCKVTVHQGLQSVQVHDVVSIHDISKSSQVSRDVTSVVISSVFNSYSTILPAVHTLLCSDNDLLYFTCSLNQSEEKYQFVKGKLLKSSIKVLQTLNKNIYDIAINKDGEIFLKEFGVNTIQILSPAGEVKTVLDSSPMKVLAIHVNKDDEVIVGLREQGPPVPVHFSVRQVIIFGSDYKRKVTLEFDKKGNKLFSYAARIRTDSTNVVYVIDQFDNDKNGRIVAVDRNARLKFTYDGQKDLGKFRPSGITITPSDNIVVADCGNDALHVINPSGDLLGLQLIFKDLGISRPYCVCFDTEGYLLIGCGRDKNQEYGKIYVAKMTDSLV